MRRTPAARSDVFCRARGRGNKETRALQTRFSFARGGARADEKCVATRKRIRAARDVFASVAAFAKKSESARRHFQRRSVNPASSSHAREFRVRGSFSVGESDWRKKRCQSTAVDRSRKDGQEFRILGGCPRLENVSRSICSVRKSYPRGYFFAPDLNVKELVADPRAFRTRAPSRTHAFDDARRAHERVPHDFVRARIHPHVAGTRHRPIVGRPSVRVAGAFSRAPIHDAGARPDGPRDRPHARARARERQGDQPCGRRTDRAGTASSVLRGASGWREARANSRHRPKSCTMPRHAFVAFLTVHARTDDARRRRDFRELTDEPISLFVSFS